MSGAYTYLDNMTGFQEIYVGDAANQESPSQPVVM